MATTRIYTVSTQFTSGLSTEKFHTQIEAGSISVNLVGMISKKDGAGTRKLTLEFDGELSGADETALDNLANAHIETELADNKAEKNLEIDGKTRDLIGQGFVDSGETFSLSGNAQFNWNALKTHEIEFTWPHKVSTKDDKQYSLPQANLSVFWTTAKDRVDAVLTGGSDLKQSIFDAVDQAALDAITDART